MTKPAPIANVPEFHEAYNNGVTALYVVHPRLLELDNQPRLWGKPFLFTNKCPDRKDSFHLGGSRNNRIVYAGPMSEMTAIRERTEQSHALGGAALPEFVNIKGYGKVDMRELASWRVPFSFGIYHESESLAMEQGRIVVRTDWEAFKAGILTRFDDEKRERRNYENSFGYKARTALHIEHLF